SLRVLLVADTPSVARALAPFSAPLAPHPASSSGVTDVSGRGHADTCRSVTSLTLLKACRRTLFELSAAGGQLVEFGHLLEFETEAVLVAYRTDGEDPAHISAMTTSAVCEA
ncbi:MAG: hypothetical protein ACLQHS_05645, partial [Candidatus Limnocylindrales bacterium]